MDHFLVRDYLPQTGRFNGSDPVMEYSNPYSYVANRPLNFVDPLGMQRNNGRRDDSAGPVRFGFLASGGVMGTSYYVDGVEVTGDFFYDAAGVENSSELAYKYSGYYKKISGRSRVQTGDAVVPENDNSDYSYDDNGVWDDYEYWEYIDAVSTIANASAATIGFTQTAMLEARQALNLHSKINSGSFAAFRSAYSGLGVAGRALTRSYYGLALVSTFGDYSAMQVGQLSSVEFAYNTAGTVSSISAGYLITYFTGSAATGWIGGATISAGFYVSKGLYNGFKFLQREANKFENDCHRWFLGY